MKSNLPLRVLFSHTKFVPDVKREWRMMSQKLSRDSWTNLPVYPRVQPDGESSVECTSIMLSLFIILYAVVDNVLVNVEEKLFYKRSLN